MTQHPGNAIVALGAPAPKKASFKRLGQMVGAAAISAGMVGVFALPAYATTETEGLPDGFVSAPAQQLTTAEGVEVPVPLEGPSAEVSEAVIAQQKAEEAARAAAESGAAASTAAARGYSGADIPAGVGAQGIVSAALAQIGVFQDCTALVEKSLRAVGIPAGDLGTQIGEYTALGGTLVTSGDYAPGDVLIWSGRHVAVYIGNGQAVHGGYGGNQTVVASAFLDGSPSGVVRF